MRSDKYIFLSSGFPHRRTSSTKQYTECRLNLNSFHQVCLYDRRGHGWSESLEHDSLDLHQSEPQWSGTSVEFLRELIRVANISSPLYFIGSSYWRSTNLHALSMFADFAVRSKLQIWIVHEHFLLLLYSIYWLLKLQNILICRNMNIYSGENKLIYSRFKSLYIFFNRNLGFTGFKGLVGVQITLEWTPKNFSSTIKVVF